MMEIQIKLSKEQTAAWDFLEDPITKRVLYGGQAGGGKSYLICFWQIYRRLTYPNSRGYIGREILKNLKNSILVTFFDVAAKMNLKQGEHYTYNDNKSIIEFYNGSQIVLLDLFDYPSDPNWDSLGSTEYTDGAIEEGVQVSQRAAGLLLSRTRWKLDEFDLKPKQLITCNPGESWIRDEIVVPAMEHRLPEQYKFVTATLDSNPNKEFVKMYKDLLENELDIFDRERLLFGNWFANPRTGGEIYKKFSEQKHIGTFEYNPELPLHMTFDFNVNPYMTAGIWQGEKKVVRKIMELCLPDPKNTTKAVCQAFSNLFHYHEAGLFIYGDPAGRAQDTRSEKGYNDYRIIQDELFKYKPAIRVASKAPPVVMRVNFINNCFESNFEGINIAFDKSCLQTIRDLSFLKEDSDGTKKKEKVKNPVTGITYEKYGHTSDADDYFLCKYFESDFNLYLKGRVVGKPVIQGRQWNQLKSY